MNTVSKTTVVCILAILVVVISSGRYSMVQVRGVMSIEQPLKERVPECLHLKTMMANDTADRFYASLFKNVECPDVLARSNMSTLK